jgi:hypothetical protein
MPCRSSAASPPCSWRSQLTGTRPIHVILAAFGEIRYATGTETAKTTAAASALTTKYATSPGLGTVLSRLRRTATT